jgi:predicted dehydrogenase
VRSEDERGFVRSEDERGFVRSEDMKAPRVAVVGAGHMGRYHARKFAELAGQGLCELAGVCDLDAERAGALAAEHGTAPLADLAEVAARADAACVAVSTLAHGQVAGALIEAGLDVLIEKPIAATRAEARALLAAAQRRGRVLQVGHIERFSPAFREILPVLRQPRFIEAHRIGPYPRRGTDVSVILDLMIHDLDLVCELAGSELAHVEAIGVPVLSATHDIANARLRFTNGCVLNLTASRVSLEPLRKIRVFQSDAYIAMDFGTQRIQVVRRGERPAGGGLPKIDVQELRFDPADALLAQARAFLAAVRREREPEVSGEDALRALDMALRIQEAIPELETLA